MAGKLVFLSTTIFGRVGRAATKPIYGRQYAKCSNRKLTKPIRDALLTLQHVLQTAPPRHVQWALTQPLCNFLYADAFFEMGDRRFKPSSTDIPTVWQPGEAHLLHNGWGVVFFPRKTGWPQAITMRGEVPAHILQIYCQRQAFIYFLEAWAQVLPSIALAEYLDDAYFAFVDNEAAKHALLRGYGSDERINCLLGMYWAFQATQQKAPWLERVTSSANLSDAISRNDFSANQANGWLHIELDLTATYATLSAASDNMQFAVQLAHLQIQQSLQQQIRHQLAQANVPI